MHLDLQKEGGTVEITKLPLLRNPEGNSVIISWETKGNAGIAVVKWGTTGDKLEHAIHGVETTQVDECHFLHKVVVSYPPELRGRNRIYYSVGNGAVESET